MAVKGARSVGIEKPLQRLAAAVDHPKTGYPAQVAQYPLCCAHVVLLRARHEPRQYPHGKGDVEWAGAMVGWYPSRALLGALRALERHQRLASRRCRRRLWLLATVFGERLHRGSWGARKAQRRRLQRGLRPNKVTERRPMRSTWRRGP